MRFSGKKVIVTGAGSGFGRATALRFAAEGAQVIAADIDWDTVNTTVENIRDNGGIATAVIAMSG